MSRAGVLDITWFSPTVSPTNALGAPGGSTLALAAGDVFVGGGFTALGTASPAAVRLVRLSGTTGSLVQNFAADATVHRLRAATDGRTVFVGGAFTTVAGSARNRLAAITVATNGLTGLNPGGFDGPVFALDVRGHSLVVGGTFSTPASRVAAIDLDAGTVVASFRPLTVTSGSARAVAFVGNAVALGGDFVGTVAVAGGGAGAARQQTALVFAE